MAHGTDRTTDRPSTERIQRVEGLLASVQDTLATLQKLGTQLEQEVARALYQDGAAGGSALATLELENSRLKHALEGRAVIEQAKGVIIARTGGSGPDAFGVLTHMARAEGIGVRDAAAAVVEAGRHSHQPPDNAVDGRPAVLGVSLPDAAAQIRAALAELPTEASSIPSSPVDEDQLNPLNPLNQVILADTESSEPGSARRRWRPASPSHPSKRDAPRYRSSAF